MQSRSYCFNCEYYKAHYLRGRSRFYCAGVGDCTEKGMIVPQEENCELWKKSEKAEINKKDAYRAVVRATMEISALKSILEKNEEK